MSIELYREGYDFASKLISEGNFVDDHGDWTEVNPGTEQENAFIERVGIQQYALWHLGVHPDKDRDDKTAWAFPYGDYQKVHRAGLLAAEERAKQYGYEEIRRAALDLLSELDAAVRN